MLSRRLSKEVPLTSSRVDPTTLKADLYDVVMKQNKYYAVEKTPKKPTGVSSLILSPMNTVENTVPLSTRGSVQIEKGILSKRSSFTSPQKSKKRVTINTENNKEHYEDSDDSRLVKTAKASIGSGSTKKSQTTKSDLRYCK